MTVLNDDFLRFTANYRPHSPPIPRNEIFLLIVTRLFFYTLPITELSHEHDHSLTFVRAPRINNKTKRETNLSFVFSNFRKCCVNIYREMLLDFRRSFTRILLEKRGGRKGCPRYTCTRVSIENKRAAPLAAATSDNHHNSAPSLERHLVIFNLETIQYTLVVDGGGG